MNFVSNLIFKMNTNSITVFLYLHIEINTTIMRTMSMLCGCCRFIISGKYFNTTEDLKRASRFEEINGGNQLNKKAPPSPTREKEMH